MGTDRVSAQGHWDICRVKIYSLISTERGKKRISVDYFTPLSEKVGNIDTLKM